MNKIQKEIPLENQQKLLKVLKLRFTQNIKRHKDISWSDVLKKLESNPNKLLSLNEMESTGGEPDVIGYDELTNEYIFYDCSPETPKGRRSLCYDKKALETRKSFKPKYNVVDIAKKMNIGIMSEEQYRNLQSFGEFDLKTSSWLKTLSEIRTLGGAIFGDRRFDRVFIYHNGAESYYASRGFRGVLKV